MALQTAPQCSPSNRPSGPAPVYRFYLLLGEAAERSGACSAAAVQLRAQQRSLRERRRQWHELRELRQYAQSVAADAAERHTISQNLRAPVAAMLNRADDVLI